MWYGGRQKCQFCCGPKNVFDKRLALFSASTNMMAQLPDHMIIEARRYFLKQTLDNVVVSTHQVISVLQKLLVRAAVYEDIIEGYLAPVCHNTNYKTEIKHTETIKDLEVACALVAKYPTMLFLNYNSLMQCSTSRSRSECVAYIAKIASQCGSAKTLNTHNIKHQKCIDYLIHTGLVTWDDFTMSEDRVRHCYFERYTYTWPHQSTTIKQRELPMIFYRAVDKRKPKFLEFIAANCGKVGIDLRRLCASVILSIENNGSIKTTIIKQSRSDTSISQSQRRQVVSILWNHLGLRLDKDSLENMIKL